MDLLYTRYSNPLDLMNIYINQGRFGHFVTGFLEAEYERRKAEAEKDEDWKLWMVYVHSETELCFAEWKDNVLKSANTQKGKQNRDDDLTDDDISAIVNNLFPS